MLPIRAQIGAEASRWMPPLSMVLLRCGASALIIHGGVDVRDHLVFERAAGR